MVRVHGGTRAIRAHLRGCCRSCNRRSVPLVCKQHVDRLEEWIALSREADWLLAESDVMDLIQRTFELLEDER